MHAQEILEYQNLPHKEQLDEDSICHKKVKMICSTGQGLAVLTQCTHKWSNTTSPRQLLPNFGISPIVHENTPLDTRYNSKL